jgi:hypothetical protein
MAKIIPIRIWRSRLPRRLLRDDWWLEAWIVPLGIFAVFLALFSSANPLIEHQLTRIDLRAGERARSARELGFGSRYSSS